VNPQPVQILHVTLDLGSPQILKVGRLAWVNRRILFEYDPTFLASQLQISPFNF
jgi:serine/threonine-protein kinase HipA